MKFNWGTGIAIVIIAFIVSMIGIIVFSMNQQVNLVSPDYYPKGVNHEEHLQKQRNLAGLGVKVEYEINQDSLKLIFPEEFKNKNITGSVQFYFMTNYEKDIKQEIKLDLNLSQSFLLQQFETGRYLIKLDWSDGEKSYYQEIDMNF
jgi:hypothetical protein